MNIIRYSIRSFFTNEYYSIIRFASKQLFVATLLARHDDGGVPVMSSCCHAVILSRCHLVKAIPSTLSLSASASVWAEKQSMVSSRLQQGP